MWCMLVMGAPLFCFALSLQEVKQLLHSIWRRLCHHGNRRDPAPVSQLAGLGCTCACMKAFCAYTSARRRCMCASVWCITLARSACTCVCKCVRASSAGMSVQERDAHSHTHLASHSQFVLQALFLARGTYIIRVTLGEIKGRQKTSPAFPLPSIWCFPCPAFIIFIFLLHFFYFSATLSFPPCFLLH